MSAFSQMGAVLRMNIASLPGRVGSSSVIVIGIAGVSAVLISILSMVTGVVNMAAATGRPDRAIVLLRGSDAELPSVLSREAVTTITDAPGIARDSAGKPLASADILLIVDIPRGDGTTANMTLRGIGAEGLAVRPEINLASGRMFRPAVHELIVGRSAENRFTSLAVGSRLMLRGSDWTIVGSFDSGGDARESELIGDAETIASALRRDAFQSVTVLLDSPSAFDRFKDALTANPTLAVDVTREPDFLRQEIKPLTGILLPVAVILGAIMAIGATFGALNSMYAAVATRTREIATLRAIGFGPSAVVLSILAEAVMLAMLGGLAGALFVLAFFQGNIVTTTNGGFGLTQTLFRMIVTPELVAVGVALAAFIGLIGGLFPAIRAARLPVAVGLRATF
ncbi:MAG TPA: ABC transporter permease [Alphaproteobacteria bacterium]|nr:ABC transporter permease [Alphaproteobacteria bacterium]